MEDAIFGPGNKSWHVLFPEARWVADGRALGAQRWRYLVLLPGFERMPLNESVTCQSLLAPGESTPEQLRSIRAERVITYGLSLRDTLTLSSLERPTLCVQRAVTGVDGTAIEPQEFPLPPLPGDPGELLPFLGLLLLHTRLTDGTA